RVLGPLGLLLARGVGPLLLLLLGALRSLGLLLLVLLGLGGFFGLLALGLARLLGLLALEPLLLLLLLLLGFRGLFSLLPAVPLGLGLFGRRRRGGIVHRARGVLGLVVRGDLAAARGLLAGRGRDLGLGGHVLGPRRARRRTSRFACTRGHCAP